jgi:hypothetical protein
MQHSREDQLVPLTEIDRVISKLQADEALALRFKVVKADGTLIDIHRDHAIGRSGGLAQAILELRKIRGI